MKSNINYNLKSYIEEMYLREIEPYELADKYFEENLFSAAATYYIFQLNYMHENKDYNNNLKAYCFYKIAQCYFNQQKDQQFSGWQLSLIHDMCKESIAYEPFYNINVYLLLGKCYILKNEFKNAYFVYNEIILNLTNFEISLVISDLLNESSFKFVNFVYEYFDLCEMYKIIKYDEIYRNIINFMNMCEDKFSFADFDLINERYRRHLNYVKEDEKDIMNGNIHRYY